MSCIKDTLDTLIQHYSLPGFCKGFAFIHLASTCIPEVYGYYMKD